MHLAFSAILLAFLLCGCAEKTPATPGPTAVASPPPAQLPIRSPLSTPHRTAASNADPGKTAWQIQVAQFHDHQIERLGLKPLFDSPLQTNSFSQDTLAASSTYALAQRTTNVSLNIRSGVYVGTIPADAASNLVNKFTVTAGVDLLTPPGAQLMGTNLTQVSVQDSMTLMISASGRTTPAPITVGQLFDLRLNGMNGDAPILEFACLFEQFKGYSNNVGSSRDPIPVPLLDLALLGTTAELASSEALLLGTTIDPQRQGFVDRIPYISDIPLFGRLFTKSQWQTNQMRQLIIIRRVSE